MHAIVRTYRGQGVKELFEILEQRKAEFEDLIRRRGMVRSFRPDPVSDDLVQKLLRNAVRAPSAGHLQPW